MLKKKPSDKEIESTTDWGTWEKEPSAFPWFYEEKETCYILDGEAEVTDESGGKLSFGKGDWVEFEKGLSCTWKISRRIRKKFRFGD